MLFLPINAVDRKNLLILAVFLEGNPHLAQLGIFCEELEAVWGDLRVPSSLIIDEIYEFSADIAHRQKGHLNLSTVHGAKGREFCHVVLLDGGNWQRPSADERRLYYVGMTRARETLTLCEGFRQRNPFTSALNDVNITHCPLPKPLPSLHGLERKYETLGLASVDLGFAGRKPASDPIHGKLELIEIGQKLEVFPLNNGWGLRLPGKTQALGRLASKYVLPSSGKIEAHVEAVIRRYQEQSSPEFLPQFKNEYWSVLLPALSWLEDDGESGTE